MVGMREINDHLFLSTDVDPQEEDAEKSVDFDYISEFRVYFSIFEEGLVVVLSGWQSNWFCWFCCVNMSCFSNVLPCCPIHYICTCVWNV